MQSYSLLCNETAAPVQVTSKCPLHIITADKHVCLLWWYCMNCSSISFSKFYPVCKESNMKTGKKLASLKIWVFWDVIPRHLANSHSAFQPMGSFHRFTWSNIPEDLNPWWHHFESLKPCIWLSFFSFCILISCFMASSQPSLPSTQPFLSPKNFWTWSWNGRFLDKKSAGISHLPKHVICPVITSTFICPLYHFKKSADHLSNLT